MRDLDKFVLVQISACTRNSNEKCLFYYGALYFPFV